MADTGSAMALLSSSVYIHATVQVAGGGAAARTSGDPELLASLAGIRTRAWMSGAPLAQAPPASLPAATGGMVAHVLLDAPADDPHRYQQVSREPGCLRQPRRTVHQRTHQRRGLGLFSASTDRASRSGSRCPPASTAAFRLGGTRHGPATAHQIPASAESCLPEANWSPAGRPATASPPCSSQRRDN